MRIKLALLIGALFFVGGTSYADIVQVFCAPGLNASGQVVTKCTTTPEGGGGDPTGSWQQPEPGWNGYGGISVISATYGWNCGASYDNAVYDLGTACDGASSCQYAVDYRVLGDPAPGCAKTFQAMYVCAGSTIRHAVYVSAEAGFDSIATLTCQ